MYKATRELIKLRQPHSESLISKVSVNRINTGEPKWCYDNACFLHENDPSIQIISGWFVNKWDLNTSSCLIVSHYWNIDSNGQFIDSTPMDDTEGEYVVDTDLGIFAALNYDSLQSSLCSSILIKEDEILGVDFREQGKVYRKFNDFSTKSLFAELNESSN